MPMRLLPILLLIIASAVQAQDLQLTHHSIRQDRSTVSPEEWQWNEGWPRVRQFFPRYFKPAATAHLFVQNTGNTALDITDVRFNGKPIDEVCTKADYAGPVIWYRSNPEVVQPGQFGMVYARLRTALDQPITMTVTAGGDTVSAEFGDNDLDDIRFGFVGFNDDIDRIYAYVENWTDGNLNLTGVRLDGSDVTNRCEVVNADFTGGPALIEIALEAPLANGSFHVLEATTAEGATAVSQIRARDSTYRLGAWQSGAEDCHAKFFNTMYHPQGYPEEEDWWEGSSEQKLGLLKTGSSTSEKAIRIVAKLPADKLIYNNVDEPDAHEPPGLPYMSRCGINIMAKVEPAMRLQRRLDPHHDTTFVCNRTYAPLNWMTYGEVPDIFISDCYVPNRWMGYDLKAVYMQMRAMNAASSPRPCDLMIWGCMNTGYNMKRSPTPEENDMVVHYAVGEGAKGLYYFCDWNSYPQIFEGGYFIGMRKTNMLWKNIGRMNAEITRIAPLLSKGHPFQIAESDNAQLYVRSLLCGKDNFVVVMVNRSHQIHSPTNNKGALQPFIYPVEDATVSFNLPPWFKARAAVQVSWDKVDAVDLRGGSLQVDGLRTSKVLVISQDADIASKLTLPADRMALFLESEKPTLVTDNPPIKAGPRPGAKIKLDAAAIEKGELTLDLTQIATIDRAADIRVGGGELRQVPGEWLGLFTPKDWHGDGAVVFRFESAVPLKKITAVLDSSTPNIAACANNSVGISFDNAVSFPEERSFKMAWPGHGKLTYARGADAPVETFHVNVRLRDPGIVKSDEATNLATSLKISWEK